jgi:NitT/TauT family transport system substrate-binding protein
MPGQRWLACDVQHRSAIRLQEKDPMRRRTLFRLMACALLALAPLARPATAQAPTPVRLVLDWAPQPHQSPWFLALDRGHFAREGLAVTIDRGFGSGDAMNKLGAGSYDIGLGDGNLLLQWNHQHPNNRLLMVYLHMDRGAHSIITMRGRGVTTLQDLAGKRIGRTTGDIIGPLWPAFSRAHNIDTSRIEWVSVTPQLRDSLLLRGQIEAAGAFSSTSLFNLLNLGVKQEDVIVFQFADNGFELFGNGLIVTAAYAERNPEVLRRFIRATIAGARDAVSDMPAAIASVTRRDPTANAQTETERFRYMLRQNIATPQIVENGFGEVSPARLARVTAFLAEAFEIAPAPPPSSFYTDAFLPPRADRQYPR